MNRHTYFENNFLKIIFFREKVLDLRPGNILIFREKVLDLRPKSVCAVEMSMYVHWTRININRKDVHASLISFHRKKICIKNMCV